LCQCNPHRVTVDADTRGLGRQRQQISATTTTEVDNVLRTRKLAGPVLGDALVAGLLKPVARKPQLVAIVELGDCFLAHR
jgi:hypothetical protein